MKNQLTRNFFFNLWVQSLELLACHLRIKWSWGRGAKRERERVRANFNRAQLIRSKAESFSSHCLSSVRTVLCRHYFSFSFSFCLFLEHFNINTICSPKEKKIRNCHVEISKLKRKKRRTKIRNIFNVNYFSNNVNYYC